MRKKHDNIRLYHVDHLGSTSLVTDAEGLITQHVAYIPYGEVFVEQRNGSWNTPYLFNAKELDEETGLYYYGARYLDPAGAMWLSVDPIFHVGASPYAYCMGNPIKLLDPNGKEEYFSDDGTHLGNGTNADDESKYVVTSKADSKLIKRNKKNGGTTDVKDLNSAYKLPSDVVLSEALDVLERTGEDGYREHSSLVGKNGEIHKGQPGEAVTKDTETATTTFPSVTDDNEIEASIHSHPTKYFAWEESGYLRKRSWSATEASDVDVAPFSRYNCNIIVGKKGHAKYILSGANSVPAYAPIGVEDNREMGIGIYGRKIETGQSPDLWLNESAVKKILGK